MNPFTALLQQLRTITSNVSKNASCDPPIVTCREMNCGRVFERPEHGRCVCGSRNQGLATREEIDTDPALRGAM